MIIKQLLLVSIFLAIVVTSSIGCNPAPPLPTSSSSHDDPVAKDLMKMKVPRP